MYQPLPSTFASASAILGSKKSERPMGRDVRLVRESDSRIVVKYGLSDVIAYEGNTVEVLPDSGHTSVVRSLLNQALSATGAVIAEAPKSAQAYLQAFGVADGGWMLFVPGQKAVPFTDDGAILPIL